MARIRRIKPRWLALAAGLLALVIAGVFALPREQAAARSELALARERWSARSFDSYRMIVQEQIGPRVCQQDVRIEGEKIGEVLQNSCGRPPSWTATTLFSWIGQLETPEADCFPSASFCACRVQEVTRTVYDPQLGYPRSITYQWTLEPNIRSLDYWRYTRQMNTLASCAQDGREAIQVNVVSLIPNP